tara:strand:+ start:840 stop:1778 length:939 start_codon:yes stop_codon:yes gene_type:complete
MLSFARGKPIAKIVEGKKKGTIIHTFGENIFDKDTKSDITIPKDQRSQLLDKEFFKEEKIGRNKREYFSELIDGKINPKEISGEMRESVEKANELIDFKLKTQLIFDDKETKVFPLPQKLSERIYVPAPSGSGKSTFIGMYLEELRKRNKKRPIYIFSRVEKDPPLDKFKNTTRIPLEQEYFDRNPLDIETFRNGILIFDDIDTILDKQLVKYIRNFRDDVLETGRHYDITIISTSHLIANFLATRTLINEANAIVLFPKGSSFYAVSNFLERYMGFSKKQIRMVEKIPTRWIWFWKEYPKYAIHEKGAFIF